MAKNGEKGDMVKIEIHCTKKNRLGYLPASFPENVQTQALKSSSKGLEFAPPLKFLKKFLKSFSSWTPTLFKKNLSRQRCQFVNSMRIYSCDNLQEEPECKDIGRSCDNWAAKG